MKRKAIGRSFIEIFEQEAKAYPGVKWLCQGTIYPDVIESVSVYGPSATIKSHHNVGGLPEKLHLKIIEPLRLLFKDEVRKVGRNLGLKEEILGRHPFPGPGLAIRIIGEVTEDKVAILQKQMKFTYAILRKVICTMRSGRQDPFYYPSNLLASWAMNGLMKMFLLCEQLTLSME